MSHDGVRRFSQFVYLGYAETFMKSVIRVRSKMEVISHMCQDCCGCAKLNPSYKYSFINDVMIYNLQYN